MAVVDVPPGEATKAAQELLALAAAKGYPPEVVRTQSEGLYGFSFVVPDDLLAKDSEPDPEPEPEEPAPKKRGRPKGSTNKSTTDTDEKEE